MVAWCGASARTHRWSRPVIPASEVAEWPLHGAVAPPLILALDSYPIKVTPTASRFSCVQEGVGSTPYASLSKT